MEFPLGAFVLLDVLAAVLTLGVVAFFAAAWRRSGAPLHLLFAAGFGLVGAGFLAVSTSQFDLARTGEAWDAFRLATQTGGALTLLLAYLSARRHGAARPLQVLGWLAAAGGLGLLALYLLVPPADALPPLDDAFAFAHAVQFGAFLGCVALSLEAYRRSTGPAGALVPGAFLLWALSKYTWLLIDLTAAQDLVPLVFVWRFGAIALLLLAVGLPARALRRRDHAAP